MVFLSIYGILYIIGKLWISSFKWDTMLSMNSVHSPFIHYLLYNICTQISRLLSIQLPLYKSMRYTRESLLSTSHSHTLSWMNLIAILWYYNKNHVGALKLALIINFVGSTHNQWRNIGVGQEWQDTIPEMVPQHPCYQQMKPRHLGLISSLT